MPRRRAVSEPDTTPINPVRFRHRAAYERFTPHAEFQLPLPTSTTIADMPRPWLPRPGPSRLVDSLLLSLAQTAPADNPVRPVNMASDFMSEDNRYEAKAFLSNAVLQKVRVVKRRARGILTHRQLELLPAEARQMVLEGLLDEQETPLDCNIRVPRNVNLLELVTDPEVPLDFEHAGVAADMRAMLLTRLSKMARRYVTEHEAFMLREVLAPQWQVYLGYGVLGLDDERGWWVLAGGAQRRRLIQYKWEDLRRIYETRLEFQLYDMAMLVGVVDRVEAVLGLDCASVADSGSRDAESSDVMDLDIEAPSYTPGPSGNGKRKRDEDDSEDGGTSTQKKVKRLKTAWGVSHLPALEMLTLEQDPDSEEDESELGSDLGSEWDGDWDDEFLAEGELLESDLDLDEEFEGLEDFELEHEAANRGS